MSSLSDDSPESGCSVIGPVVAGLWYAEDPIELAAQIDGLLDLAGQPAPSGAGKYTASLGGLPVSALPDPSTVGALVMPHAGLRYSGAVAAAAATAVRGVRRRNVLAIGPAHHVAFSGVALPTARACGTPLGEVEIDRDGVEALAASPTIRIEDTPFAREHSLEALLPPLQRALAPGWRLIPALVGVLSTPGELAAAAEAMRAVIDDQTLVAISSDFTHHGPRFGYVPFERDVARRIGELDRGAIDALLGWSASRFEAYVDRTGATICGRHALSLLLRMSDARDGALAAYDVSGRITGDWEHSVSYASIVFGAAR